MTTDPKWSTAGWYWIGGWVYYLSDAVAKRSMEMYPETLLRRMMLKSIGER